MITPCVCAAWRWVKLKAMAKKEPKDAQAPPPFEESLGQLEKIVHNIESGQVTLEQSLEQYERGTKLIRHCRSILDRAESKIKVLTAETDGRGETAAQSDV